MNNKTKIPMEQTHLYRKFDEYTIDGAFDEMTEYSALSDYYFLKSLEAKHNAKLSYLTYIEANFNLDKAEGAANEEEYAKKREDTIVEINNISTEYEKILADYKKCVEIDANNLKEVDKTLPKIEM